ncbi:hypothetical protein IEQ34_022265 [Dendrobium chrysotoxum]|uniref:Uncharacterized protein n=1 Tax=Dendrobium chrysotoxum TaxID=161865 RepID=A0AAV7FX11_DENCH|nr:hypothetical protein IEQ34_022265 [Dendrobium chrysotoxum]
MSEELEGLNKELRHQLVPLWIQELFELVERARLIEIDLVTLTSMYEVSYRYDVRKRRGRERDSDKKSKHSDLRGSTLKRKQLQNRKLERRWILIERRRWRWWVEVVVNGLKVGSNPGNVLVILLLLLRSIVSEALEVLSMPLLLGSHIGVKSGLPLIEALHQAVKRRGNAKGSKCIGCSRN